MKAKKKKRKPTKAEIRHRLFNQVWWRVMSLVSCPDNRREAVRRIMSGEIAVVQTGGPDSEKARRIGYILPKDANWMVLEAMVGAPW